MSVGIADHRVTKGSPPCNSNTKTSALTRMMTAVTTERCRGRRDASPSGIMVPMLSSTLAGAGGEPRSCVSSRRRRRGTYTYRETLQHTPDPAPNVVSADPAPETVGSPELEGELPLSGTKRGRGRGLTTTPTARGAVDECPTAKETPQTGFSKPSRPRRDSLDGNKGR